MEGRTMSTFDHDNQPERTAWFVEVGDIGTGRLIATATRDDPEVRVVIHSPFADAKETCDLAYEVGAAIDEFILERMV